MRTPYLLVVLALLVPWHRQLATASTTGSPVEIVEWIHNPQDPRSKRDYSLVMDHAVWEKCGAANADPTSDSYNNETVYWDCLDPYLSAARKVCSHGGEMASEPSEQPATVSIENTGSTSLTVFGIDSSGEVEYSEDPVGMVPPGQTESFETTRGSAFAIESLNRGCIGVAKAMESRNGFSFRSPNILELMEDLLWTYPGERLNSPRFGVGLPAIVGTADPTVITSFESQALGGIALWLGQLVEISAVEILQIGPPIEVQVVYRERRKIEWVWPVLTWDGEDRPSTEGGHW